MAVIGFLDWQDFLKELKGLSDDEFLSDRRVVRLQDYQNNTQAQNTGIEMVTFFVEAATEASFSTFVCRFKIGRCLNIDPRDKIQHYQAETEKLISLLLEDLLKLEPAFEVRPGLVAAASESNAVADLVNLNPVEVKEGA